MGRRRKLRISPSQIKRWRACPRKSAFQLCTDHEPDRGPIGGAELGSRCHAMAEDYMIHGTLPDLEEEFVDGKGKVHYPGKIVKAALPMLPKPGTAEVETRVQFDVFSGRIDFREPGVIGDLKTTSNLKYALTEDTLPVDPQGVIYASSAFADGADDVTLKWAYVETKGRHRTKLVQVRLTKDEISPRLEELKKTADLIMKVHERQIDPHLLPAKTNNCFAYGRPCEWSHVCKLTEQERLMGMFRDSEDQVDARVAAVLAEAVPTALGPHTHPVVPRGDLPVPPPPPPPAPVVQAPPPPPPPPVESDVFPEEKVVKVKVLVDPINPPEAPEDSPELAPPVEETAPDKIILREQDLDALEAKGDKEARKQLKAWMVQEGLIESKRRDAMSALLKIAREHLSGPVEKELTLEERVAKLEERVAKLTGGK